MHNLFYISGLTELCWFEGESACPAPATDSEKKEEVNCFVSPVILDLDTLIMEDYPPIMGDLDIAQTIEINNESKLVRKTFREFLR